MNLRHHDAALAGRPLPANDPSENLRASGIPSNPAGLRSWHCWFAGHGGRDERGDCWFQGGIFCFFRWSQEVNENQITTGWWMKLCYWPKGERTKGEEERGARGEKKKERRERGDRRRERERAGREKNKKEVTFPQHNNKSQSNTRRGKKQRRISESHQRRKREKPRLTDRGWRQIKRNGNTGTDRHKHPVNLVPQKPSIRNNTIIYNAGNNSSATRSFCPTSSSNSYD